jgi:hypothetical protein
MPQVRGVCLRGASKFKSLVVSEVLGLKDVLRLQTGSSACWTHMRLIHGPTNRLVAMIF